MGAVDDPELRRGLGELGMVRSVRARRRDVAVVVAIPVDGWPGRDELVDRIRAALAPLADRADVRVEVTTMTDEERAELHRRLALGPGGEPAVSSAPGPSKWRPSGRTGALRLVTMQLRSGQT